MASQQPEYADELALPDGRTLAYTEYGDPEGTPVVYCHGTPGTRVSGTILREAAASLGVRVLAPDRPGFGQSEFGGDHTLREWASDVAALADALDCPQYGVLGFSGGAPFALACAAHAPERVTRCAVVSGFAPPGVATGELEHTDRVGMGIAKWSTHLCRPLTWFARREIEAADQFTDVVGKPTDGDLADPRVGETGRILLSDVKEAVQQGSLPLAAEYGVLGSQWDFDLADVAAPTCVFHGMDDDRVPFAAAEHVASDLPDGRLVRYENADHYRPLVEHAEAVLSWAAGDQTDPSTSGNSGASGAADDEESASASATASDPATEPDQPTEST
jgi:pimeloyl-ACP methyl ester carboxylesterase